MPMDFYFSFKGIVSLFVKVDSQQSVQVVNFNVTN